MNSSNPIPGAGTRRVLAVISRIPARFLVAAVVVLLLAAASHPNSPNPSGQVPSNVFVEGEELVYNVRYGFIDLGQIRIVSGKKVRQDGSTVLQGNAVIQSYRGVPFVDLHAVYESRFDSTGFSRYFLGKSRENENWSFAEYLFDYDKNRVVMRVGSVENVTERIDTLPLESLYHDGLSLFYHARENLYAGTAMEIPTLVKEKKGITYIDFTGERGMVESDFIKYPIDVIGFTGMAGFVGLFGLTGDFEGWFSNDEARVPIKANMEVIIGSVTLELVSWKRDGWVPPRGSED